ncbi:MAG TPA: type 4a pilus biogenesis protein PilO [Solirubrobacterales bacterium]
MNALKKSGTLTIVAMLVVAALAIAFWTVLLGPKRDEAAKLGAQIEQVESSLAQHRAEVATAEEARKQFPVDYQRLVVLGKAVPANDETASLLVQLNGIAKRAGVQFQDFQLSSDSGESGEAAPSLSSSGAQVTATEAAASLLPLGATIGPAGLAVMPYTLTFDGDFFQIADFIKGLDATVKTHNEKVTVDGRLITIGDFTLAAGESGFPSLTATFMVTTYLTPPGQGLTAGASPSNPLESTATPTATTTGGTP